MLRNNADVRRCSYFELGLPVVTEIRLSHQFSSCLNRYASANASIYTNKSPLSLLTEAAYTPNV